MAKKDFAIRKRQMIAKAHRTMFAIVAMSAAFAGICLVLSWFLTRKMIFNQRIISKQNQAIQGLEKNFKNIKLIDEKVKVLKTNEDLLSVKSYQDEAALQVILDALPDRANTPALGESLRRSILNVPDVEIEQLSLSKTEDETGSEFSGQSSIAYNKEYDDIKSGTPLYFRVKVAGTTLGLNQVLKNIEKSIRPFFVDRVEMQSSAKDTDDRGRKIPEEQQRHWLTLSARSFYSPGVTPEIKTKTETDK